MTKLERKTIIDSIVSAERMLDAARLLGDEDIIARRSYSYSALVNLATGLGITIDEIIDAGLEASA